MTPDPVQPLLFLQDTRALQLTGVKVRPMQGSRDDLEGSAGSLGQGPGPRLSAASGTPRAAPGKQQVPHNAYSMNEQGKDGGP